MTTIQTTAAAEHVDDLTLAGVNVLLMGPAGSGKTHSIGTLVDAGLEVFYLALEPGLESLLGYYKDNKKSIPDNLHWHTLKAPSTSFSTLMESAKLVNTMSMDSLAKMQDPNRSKHNQFIALFEALCNFPDDKTGKKFGDVGEWGTDRALVIDGMTGLGRAAMALVIGGKAMRSQADWGMAQDQLEKILRKFTDDCKCHFILLSHVERETDPVLGGTKIMASTLGKALAPKIAPMFSDVILTVRDGTKWTWDTSNSMADLKTRNLPIAIGLPQNFGAIIAKWKARGAA
jgi:hypothetical protein